MRFEVRECVRDSCRFRFPVEPAVEDRPVCPVCGAPVKRAGVYPDTLPEENEEASGNSPLLYGVLDNIRSAFNVGSILRVADGVGLVGLHLCGITPTPENAKVAKTALGAEKLVAWDYHRNVLNAVTNLRAEGVRLVVLERTTGSVSLFDLVLRPDEPVALVVGNEKAGVDPAVRDLADNRAYLPMRGQKESLNVAVAFGIAAYTLRFHLPADPIEALSGPARGEKLLE